MRFASPRPTHLDVSATADASTSPCAHVTEARIMGIRTLDVNKRWAGGSREALWGCRWLCDKHPLHHTVLAPQKSFPFFFRAPKIEASP
jgi:hypothetical protein